MKTLGNYFPVLLILALSISINSCEENEKTDFISDEIHDGGLKSAVVNEAPTIVFGPEIFTRSTGKPVLVTQEIQIEDYECLSGSFNINLLVGDSNGDFSVSSAFIKIDGEVLWGTSDFKNKTTFLSLTKNLPQSFTLEVELRGQPGDFLTLWIEGNNVCFECGNTFVDPRDGNVYSTVQIGDQCWMAENLRTTKYNDGSDIDFVPGGDAWVNPEGNGYYCWYNNDEATYKNPYGALYNWYAVETGKLSPIGWHVPSWAEFELLIDYLGGSSVAGGQLKEAGIIHWIDPNTGANNNSGFTGLPGGVMNTDVPISISKAEFSGLGESGCYWSSTGEHSRAKYLILTNTSASALWGNYICSLGWSVRCVMD